MKRHGVTRRPRETPGEEYETSRRAGGPGRRPRERSRSSRQRSRRSAHETRRSTRRARRPSPSPFPLPTVRIRDGSYFSHPSLRRTRGTTRRRFRRVGLSAARRTRTPPRSPPRRATTPSARAGSAGPAGATAGLSDRRGRGDEPSPVVPVRALGAAIVHSRGERCTRPTDGTPTSSVHPPLPSSPSKNDASSSEISGNASSSRDALTRASSSLPRSACRAEVDAARAASCPAARAASIGSNASDVVSESDRIEDPRDDVDEDAIHGIFAVFGVRLVGVHDDGDEVRAAREWNRRDARPRVRFVGVRGRDLAERSLRGRHVRHLGGEEDAGDGDLRRGVAREGYESYRRGGRVRIRHPGESRARHHPESILDRLRMERRVEDADVRAEGREAVRHVGVGLVTPRAVARHTARRGSGGSARTRGGVAPSPRVGGCCPGKTSVASVARRGVPNALPPSPRAPASVSSGAAAIPTPIARSSAARSGAARRARRIARASSLSRTWRFFVVFERKSGMLQAARL